MSKATEIANKFQCFSFIQVTYEYTIWNLLRDIGKDSIDISYPKHKFSFSDILVLFEFKSRLGNLMDLLMKYVHIKVQ